MRKLMILALMLAVAACSNPEDPSNTQETNAAASASVNGLAAASSFDAIADERERALALFSEIGKVVQHPRCVNCHPRGDRPLQGDAGIPHQPHVVRGDGGIGVSALRCTTCHGAENYANVPGHDVWFLAPAEMAWEGKSLGEICEQIKDPARNGDRTLADVADHMANDELVGYGWRPPEHLEPAPGDQETLGQLVGAWIEAGADCPDPGDA
ncbi:MAG: Isoquinoline 1-oxidoreductase subunit [Pseudomonadota bacterium]